jgi:hypothetical protein
MQDEKSHEEAQRLMIERRKERRRKATKRSALWGTLRGLGRLSPVFFLALVACMGLYVLDTSRENYVTANGSSTGNQIEVNDRFISLSATQLCEPAMLVDTRRDAAALALGPDCERSQRLRGPLEDIKYRKFENGNDIIGALAEAALRDNAEELRLSNLLLSHRKEYERQLASIDSKEIELTAALKSIRKEMENLTKGGETPAPVKTRKARGTPPNPEARLRADEQRLVKEKERNGREHDSLMAAFAEKETSLRPLLEQQRQETSRQLNFIHNEYRASLPSILAVHRNGGDGTFSERLRNRIFDEGSSLHVIYQIFKVTALIILVLTVIFVVVQLFRTLSPLATGTDTVTEQLKALLAGGGVAGSGVARTAIISVAALGVGTAGAAAIGTINDKADRALAMAESRTLAESKSLADAKAQLSARAEYAFAFKPEGGVETQPVAFPTPIFQVPQGPAPNYYLPPPVVRIIQAGTPAPNLNPLQTSIDGVAAKFDLLNTNLAKREQDCWMKLQPEVAKVSEGLTTVNTSVLGLSTQTQGVNTSLAGANTKLDELKTQLLCARQDNQFRLTQGRNWRTRFGQFFSPERYIVTDQSVVALTPLVPKALDKALMNMRAKRLAPMEKDKFLDELKTYYSGTDKDKIFKDWEALILSYTRVAR